MFMDNNTDIELGAFLVEKKLITPKQLRDAREVHRLKGGYLSQKLIELGFINDASLTTFLTCQYGYSYLPLKAYNIDDTALQMIQQATACDYLVVPIEKNDKLLTVAMVDPLNKGVVEMLRQATRCEIIVFISTRSEILEAIAKYYGNYTSVQLNGYASDHVLRDDLIIPYVSSGLYSGPNRRRYRRFNEEIDIDCYLYPNIIKVKSINISLSGMLLDSHVMLPKDMQMALCMHMRQLGNIDGVVEIARCEPKLARNTFEIGVFFNFLSPDNRDTLTKLLRSRLPR
jgi:hypothetical protein